MGNPNGKHVRIPECPADAHGEFRVEVGDEENGGFGTDFFGEFAERYALGRFRRQQKEILAEGCGKAADFRVGKRWFEYPDSITGVCHGTCAVPRSYGASGDEFEHGNRLIETGSPMASKTHGRGNVDNAPNRNLPVGNEGFYEGFSASEARLPVDGASVVGFRIRAETSELYPLARKDRSVFS